MRRDCVPAIPGNVVPDKPFAFCKFGTVQWAFKQVLKENPLLRVYPLQTHYSILPKFQPSAPQHQGDFLHETVLGIRDLVDSKVPQDSRQRNDRASS